MGSTICGNAANKNDTIGLVGLDRWDNRVLWIAAVWQNDLFQPLPSVINMITGRHWKNRLELDEKNFFSTMIISDHIHVWLYTNKKKLIKLAVGPSYSSDLVRSDCWVRLSFFNGTDVFSVEGCEDQSLQFVVQNAQLLYSDKIIVWHVVRKQNSDSIKMAHI